MWTVDIAPFSHMVANTNFYQPGFVLVVRDPRPIDIIVTPAPGVNLDFYKGRPGQTHRRFYCLPPHAIKALSYKSGKNSEVRTEAGGDRGHGYHRVALTRNVGTMTCLRLLRAGYRGQIDLRSDVTLDQLNEKAKTFKDPAAMRTLLREADTAGLLRR